MSTLSVTTGYKKSKTAQTSAEKPKVEKKIAIATRNFAGIFQRIFPDAVILDSAEDAIKYDLIIFTGGEDVDPRNYGEENFASHVNPYRDDIERSIFEVTYSKRRIKFYGTCRGHQMLNVLMGGSLFQDFPTANNGISGKVFGYHPGNHPIDFISPNDSIIRKFFENQQVVSMHHQAVRNTGSGLYPICVYKGIVEGLESSDGRVITTQFHPEFSWTSDSENPSNKFFKFLLNEW